MAELLFLLACYGLTFAVCDATVFTRPRGWVRRHSAFIDTMLDCYYCTGFWTSMAAYSALYYESFFGSRGVVAVHVVLHGFAGAAFSYVLNAGVVWLESFTPVVIPEDNDGA